MQLRFLHHYIAFIHFVDSKYIKTKDNPRNLKCHVKIYKDQGFLFFDEHSFAQVFV